MKAVTVAERSKDQLCCELVFSINLSMSFPYRLYSSKYNHFHRPIPKQLLSQVRLISLTALIFLLLKTHHHHLYHNTILCQKMLSDTYVATCTFPAGDMQVVQDRQPLTYVYTCTTSIFGHQTCQASHITTVVLSESY